MSITSPKELLHIAESQGIDIRGWSVAALSVEVVRNLGLDVVIDATGEDPGHCLMVHPPNEPFTRSVWSKLAKKTRIIHRNDQYG